MAACIISVRSCHPPSNLAPPAHKQWLLPILPLPLTPALPGTPAGPHKTVHWLSECVSRDHSASSPRAEWRQLQEAVIVLPSSASLPTTHPTGSTPATAATTCVSPGYLHTHIHEHTQSQLHNSHSVPRVNTGPRSEGSFVETGNPEIGVNLYNLSDLGGRLQRCGQSWRAWCGWRWPAQVGDLDTHIHTHTHTHTLSCIYVISSPIVVICSMQFYICSGRTRVPHGFNNPAPVSREHWWSETSHKTQADQCERLARHLKPPLTRVNWRRERVSLAPARCKAGQTWL